MSSDREKPRDKKTGCRKLICIGCLCFIAAAIFAALAIRAFIRWDCGQSAWERLPPSVLWAVEAHGIGSIISRLAETPFFISALEQQTLAPADTSEKGKYGAAIRLIAEACRPLAFLYPIFAPNFGVIGGTGGEGEMFAIVRPPAWMRWLAGISQKNAGIKRNLDFIGPGWSAALIDDWLALAASEPLLDEILSNWDKTAKPLGAMPGRGSVYLVAGFRTLEPLRVDAVEPPAIPEAGGLMFADPFALGQEEEEAPPHPASGSALRFMILPEGDSWSFEGEVNFADANLRGADFAGGAGRNAPVFQKAGPPNGWDAWVQADISPKFLDAMKAELAARAGKTSPSVDIPWKALGWLWLNDAWLAKTSGRFTLLAAKPSVSINNDIEPLPVFSLGWTWAADVDPAVAAVNFSDALMLWLESLTGPGGVRLLSFLRNRIHVEAKANGDMVGSIDLPSILANHAKPSWRLPTSSHPAGGWLASDPAGLPANNQLLELAGADPQAQSISKVVFSTTWELSDQFRSSLFTVSRERLKLLSINILPDRDELLRTLEHIDAALRAFPAGTASGEYNENDKTLCFKGSIEKR